MHYKTYIRMFKVKFEISSIGAGDKRIRLPQGVSITFDMAVVTLLTLPLCRYLIAPIIGLLSGGQDSIELWIYALITAVLIGWFSRKFEPAGRSIVLFGLDLIKFVFRSKFSDGWSKRDSKIYQGNVQPVRVSLYDQKKCGQFPASGEPDEFELRVAANVKVRRGRAIFRLTGSKTSPGIYQVSKRKIEPRRQETLVLRRRHSGTSEGGIN
ncbi:TcpE family conjugal transfer membrane protein [Paenibacillus melissococcoides]|uniref:TcpE family conjugal transfer membrane protein n=1 Tax=Paenibacillus melissococcoides TaxID=2912268 RepID=A0ABN8UD62_9BACL|nr:TcpE family conjugal transfer membrane protein [Paenibacillus melissococcoides]CAH8248468.1 TcpE family conjugal transfer membrane protein [Paenibacillus melissococcoides]CAH8722120.1 TcpE family conjugal transfer membrane protein [Paenibacillus melissococcoides]CAH8722140.1 TcpE family conjugal transfer membrane protein [Paenibacillus melissococcoides]